MSQSSWSNPLEDIFESGSGEADDRFAITEPGPRGWTFACDEQGRYTFCSPEVEELLGIAPQSFLEKRFQNFALSVESAFSLRTAIETQEPPIEMQMVFNHQQGDPVPAYLNLMQSVDQQGNPSGWYGFTYVMNAPGEEWAGEQVRAEKLEESLDELIDLTGRVVYDVLAEVRRLSPGLVKAEHSRVRKEVLEGGLRIAGPEIRYHLEWGRKFDLSDEEAIFVAEKQAAEDAGWLQRLFAPRRIVRSDFNRISVIIQSDSKKGLLVWVESPEAARDRRMVDAGAVIKHSGGLRAEVEKALENPWKEKKVLLRGRDYLVKDS